MHQETRSQLIDAAERLAITARYPDENVFFAATRTTQDAAIRIACDLDIFSVVPSDEPKTTSRLTSISITDVASAVHADPVVVGRVMRALVSCHIFTETGEDTYAHNNLSRAFLVPETQSFSRRPTTTTLKTIATLHSTWVLILSWVSGST